jgi:hypothetical protein
MNRRVLIGLIAALSAANLAAQPAKSAMKSIWSLTVEERLAQRFDHDSIQERSVAYRLGVSELRAQSTSANSDGIAATPQFEYVVDGHRNPELFLPHELYDMLLTGLSPDESLRLKQRAFYQPLLKQIGYDDAAFWSALASVNGEYLLVRFGDRPSGFASKARTQVAAEARCRARFNALEAARRLFGRNAFDRLLYTVIAPSTLVSTSATSDAHLADDLRNAEQGCR